MESELNQLIEKLKREGVERADKDAEEIIARAEKKAGEIINDAEKAKIEIIANGEKEAKDFRTASENSIKQAARDVLLSLRERVTDFFDRIVEKNVSEKLTPDVLKDIITSAVKNFRKDSELNIEVLVKEDDREKLEKAMFGALGKEAEKYLNIKGAKGAKKGFRIGEEGKDSYIDFTDAAISEAFKRYLNPRLIEVLDIGLSEPKEKE